MPVDGSSAHESARVLISDEGTMDEQSWARIGEARRAFLEEDRDPHLCKDVRLEVADSWMRSKRMGIDPQSTMLSIPISDDEYAKVWELYEPLIEIARPLLGIIEDLNLESDYIFELIARNGSSLIQTGNFNLHDIVAPQSVFNETTMGTNAHSLCMRQKMSMQIVGHEHYCTALHNLAADAAPITDEHGVVMGSLLLTQRLTDDPWSPAYHKLLSHTMGLVTSIASAVEYQLRFRRYHAAFMSADAKYTSAAVASARMNHMLNAAIDSSSEPIIVVNMEGIVLRTSPEAARILRHPTRDIVGAPVGPLLGMKWPDDFKPPITGRRAAETTVKVGERPFLLRANPVKNAATNELEGFILRMTPVNAKSNRSRGVGDIAPITFDGILGRSPQIAAAIQTAKRYASTTENVLVVGESGTGKEYFAQAIHNASRPGGPFMSINCAAIPPRLIESELFGYEGGAFTGAERGGKQGKIELADGGTLFLDEIGDMPLELQATLLRVLENKRVMRLGGKTYQQVDFRVVAATNRDLATMVTEKTFREDLLYRLSILTVELPPLRERDGDALFFAHYYLNECRCKSIGGPEGFAPETEALIETYPWPGNVRQVKNAVYSAYYAACGQLIEPDDFPAYLTRGKGGAFGGMAPAAMVPFGARTAGAHPVASAVSAESAADAYPTDASGAPLSLQQAEEQAIRGAIAYAQGNVARAAELLGTSKATLYRKLKEYRID